MKTSAEGVALIKHFEGCKLTAYRCSAGVLTIGWGHTGVDVLEGLVISQARADELLLRDLRRFEVGVVNAVAVPLNQSQFDALVAFTFNLGLGAFAKSTMLRLLNARDYAGAANQFPRWNRAGGQVLRGLTRRRHAERALFLGKPARAAIADGLAAA